MDGDGAADLREDPQEVHVETLPGVERPRDVHVIGRIGIRRVRKVPDQDRTDGEGQPVQE